MERGTEIHKAPAAHGVPEPQLRKGRPFLLGIAGGSASGKTTLARTLVERVGEENAIVVSLDSYYHCRKHIPMPERARQNFDHPDAFEFELLAHHLGTLRLQKPIETPAYCFVSHSRIEKTIPVSVSTLIIVEGIFTLYWEELRQQFCRTLFVDAHPETRFSRRIERDIRERGRTPDCVQTQWQTTVEPMYQRYCRPTKTHADEVVDGERDFDDVIERLISEVFE
jgi:uridine kinase